MRAVITLAGDGSRLLPWSRGLRKEFLPLLDRGPAGWVVKPVAHLVAERLVAAGAREIVLVVRPRDQALSRQYFARDGGLLARHNAHPERVANARLVDRLRERARFRWALQPRPRGFGDAVLRARRAVGSRPFLLHAGDGLLLGPRAVELLGRLERRREANDADAVLLVRRVADPRRYGVVEARRLDRHDGIVELAVRGMEEKPARPRSHWAATAVYAFAPSLFAALGRFRPPAGRELELTDGIRELLARGARVEALALPAAGCAWRSVGSPEGYLRALAESRRAAAQRYD